MSYVLQKQGIILKVLKVAHVNLLGVVVKYHIQVDMVDTFGIFWFLVVGCTSRDHTQYRMKASKKKDCDQLREQ